MMTDGGQLPTPIYRGALPPGVREGLAARLEASRPQYLTLPHDRKLFAYAFEGRKLIPKGNVPCAISNAAAAGDVDSDSADELIVSGGRELRKYEWTRSGLALTATGRVTHGNDTTPLWITDVSIGDVNNDSTSEVLLAGLEYMPTLRDTWTPVHPPTSSADGAARDCAPSGTMATTWDAWLGLQSGTGWSACLTQGTEAVGSLS